MLFRTGDTRTASHLQLRMSDVIRTLRFNYRGRPLGLLLIAGLAAAVTLRLGTPEVLECGARGPRGGKWRRVIGRQRHPRLWSVYLQHPIKAFIGACYSPRRGVLRRHMCRRG